MVKNGPKKCRTPLHLTPAAVLLPLQVCNVARQNGQVAER